MPDFEDLRMIDLLKTFRQDIVAIEEKRSAQLFKQASKDLQSIYAFHLNARDTFVGVEHYLKSLYTSFNYAAAIINDALKKKHIEEKKSAMLDECLEVMIKCCDVVTTLLKKKK